ncbi:MlaE family ABC transporter permease [Lacunimicrobium album]|jgi:phospholipid/cholesterol/gamma-HCH transport system permease protein
MMSSAALPTCKTPIHWLGETTLKLVCGVGDLAIFSLGMLQWFFLRGIPPGVLWTNMYRIGVQSLPVIIVTGAFIGMVLAVQTYDQLRVMGIETRIGSIVNISLLKELGPVLAATMLAGRVGSAIAAELGTMRVTEQIDALTALGANPVHYLVVPRFLACVTLIPALTLVADGMGILAGWQFSTHVLGINSFHYWHHSYTYIGLWDVFTGVFKSIFFGGSIAIVACHRGFHSDAGAEGVGKAATESFVYSFVLILMIDFLAGVFLSELYLLLFGHQSSFI